jgi:uncharacterized protein YukJ
MPLKRYGVLKGRAIQTMMGRGDKPHFQVLIEDRQSTKYRIAINIKSEAKPSEVLYFVDEDFHSEHTNKLPDLPDGLTFIPVNSPDMGLDYIRGNLFDSAKMIPLASDVEGPDNDLNEKIQSYFSHAVDHKAIIYTYGDIWGPEQGRPDTYFHFSPGNGIHDIHMNQGNSGRWETDNGIWQDGGIFIHFEQENRWAAIFLAFQSQSWCTDKNGDVVTSVEKCNYQTKMVSK